MTTSKGLVRLTESELAIAHEKQRVLTALWKVWMGFEKQTYADQASDFPSPEDAQMLRVVGRQHLQTPANDREIAVALTKLSKAMLWSSKVILDRRAFRYYLHCHLAERQYPAAVLYQAVHELEQTHKWMPAISEVLAVCREVKTAVWAAVRYLEATPQEQFALAYQVEMGVITKAQAARSLAYYARLRRQQGAERAEDSQPVRRLISRQAITYLEESGDKKSKQIC